MPLREFESVLKGEHDPPGGQPKVPDFSSAPSSFLTRSPENDFMELLWENGHVVMQGQSNRPPKRSSSFFPGSVPSLIGGGGGKSKEKEAKDHAAVAPKSGGRYHHHVLSSADALGRSDLHATGPSGQAPQLGGGGGGQEDDLVPWLNCPVDDYCSEFLSEFSSGVNPASLVPTDRISCFGQAPRDSHASFDNAINGSRAPTGGSSEVSRYPHSNPYHQLFQLPQQYHNLGSSTTTRPKEPDLMMGAADSPAPAKVLIKQDLKVVPPSKPIHHPNSNSNGGSSSTTTPVMNFSHFSRPVALVKANLLSVDRGMIRGISDHKATSTAASSNPLESTVIESAGGFKNIISASSHDDRHLDLVAAEAKSNPPVHPPSEETAAGQPAETTTIRLQEKAAACRNSRNHKKADSPSNGKAAPAADYSSICHDSNFKAAGVHESTEINHREPAIASSSVCSAIGGAASPATNDHRNRPKWNKCPEGEEYSECPSEQDHEDDSADVRRSVTDKLGTSKKRSRAAEVHNLSERRRRDRINEKMRALQELIPNCNKVDKASMLDEAIEYLKTLQMQVQIMSMGGGLCMPPMMLPPGMQSMRPPHMGPFSPMAVGMGMGMGLGFGMGMLDMSRPPLMPIPRMHAGSQYPCAVSMPAAAGLHGMRGSAANLHMFGMPGQPLPMSMPHPPPPFVPLTGMPASVNQPVASSAAATAAAEAAPVQASADHSAPPSSQQDRQLSTLEQVAKTSADNTPAEAPRQANRECFELPSIVRMDNQQPPNVGGNCEAISSGDGMHLPP